MTGLWQDVRYAIRGFARSPGLISIIVLTLALGIGTNSAIFSFVDVLLLRMLPVEDPGELVSFGPGLLGVTGTSSNPQEDHFSYAQFRALRAGNGTLAGVAATPTFTVEVAVGNLDPSSPGAETVMCELVSGNYFPMLGVKPFAGRLLNDEDDPAPGAHPAVVLSYRYWEEKFGSDPEVLGRPIHLQGEPYTIIGIAERGFSGHRIETRPQLWAPLTMQPQLGRRASWLEPAQPYERYWLNLVARLRPGVSRKEAETALNVRLQQIFAEHDGGNPSPERRAQLAKIHVTLTPFGRGLSALRELLAGSLWLLWSLAGLILLMACANLANLLLARAAGRRREVTIRLAVGAGRWRLVRQMLTESLLLASMGALGGLALADWTVPVLRAMVSEMRGPTGAEVNVDVRVVVFTAGLAVLTTLLFGLAPAVWAARRSLADTLRGGSRGIEMTRGQARAKGILVSLQVALSLVLLAGAGLFLRSLSELRSVDLGFNREGVYCFSLRQDQAALTNEVREEIRQRLLERVTAVPGVKAAAFTREIPLSGNNYSSSVEVDGYEAAHEERMDAVIGMVTPAYWDVLGIRVIEGRLLDETDRGTDTCVVNEAFARHYFAGGAATGGVVRRFGTTCRIAGVVGNVRQLDVRGDPPEMIYHVMAGSDADLDTMLVRLTGTSPNLIAAVREALAEEEPGLRVSRTVRTIDEFIDRTLGLERAMAKLSGAFAGLALLLAAVGLYGVMSYLVGQRTGEMGVRQALGATKRDLLRMVLRQAVLLLAAGLASGLVGAVALGRTVESMLYGVSATDALALASSVTVLLLAGLAAAYLPARRASRISPMEALRYE